MHAYISPVYTVQSTLKAENRCGIKDQTGYRRQQIKRKSVINTWRMCFSSLFIFISVSAN